MGKHFFNLLLIRGALGIRKAVIKNSLTSQQTSWKVIQPIKIPYSFILCLIQTAVPGQNGRMQSHTVFKFYEPNRI